MDDAKVFIVAEDASVRKGLWRLLHVNGYAVEVFGSVEQFMKCADHEGTACVLVDLPLAAGIALQRRLNGLESTMPLVFLCDQASIADSVAAVRHGAADVLQNPVDDRVLIGALCRALEGHRQTLAASARLRTIRRRLDSLTPRELETAQWIIAGLLNKQIAAELGISEKTVKIHRGRAMHKLGAGSVADFVHLCAYAGLVPKEGIGRHVAHGRAISAP